jgi:fructose-1,6-bisphosphatase I
MRLKPFARPPHYSGVDSPRTSLAQHFTQTSVDPGLADAILAVALAARTIAHHVRRARLVDVLGAAVGANVHGEQQQKLDVLANELLVQQLSRCPSVAQCASEEEEEPLVFRSGAEGRRFCVVYDPLDGSSNIDVAVSVGTIFSVLPAEGGLLQPGDRQLAAGYVVYGSSVLLALAVAGGVDLFVLDPELGEFLRVERDLRVPPRSKTYSVNEAYRDDFPAGYQRYLDHAHASGYSSRYIGSMVGDVHRTLLKGGVFLYPPTRKAPEGKLRLLYEGNPMALLMERAGGAASTGSGRILARQPAKLHERVPIVLGSSEEVEAVLKHL